MPSKKLQRSPDDQYAVRKLVWGEMERLALKGMDSPGTLTHAEISRMCRLAFVAMWRQGQGQSGGHLPPS